MLYYLLTCRSLTIAQKASKVLKGAGMPAALVRTPLGVSKEGCGYSLRVRERYLDGALASLRASELPPVRVFAELENGRYEERRP